MNGFYETEENLGIVGNGYRHNTSVLMWYNCVPLLAWNSKIIICSPVELPTISIYPLLLGVLLVFIAGVHNMMIEILTIQMVNSKQRLVGTPK